MCVQLKYEAGDIILELCSLQINFHTGMDSLQLCTTCVSLVLGVTSSKVVLGVTQKASVL